MAYTEQLLLPSRGVIYRLPDFDGVVNVKPFNTKAYKDLLTSNASEAGLKQFIDTCLVDCPIKAKNMNQNDLMAVLFKIRVLTIGNKLKTKVICPSCGKTEDIEWDLNNIEINYLYANNYPVDVELPSGKKIKVRFPTGSDLIKAKQEADRRAAVFKKSPDEFLQIYQLVALIDIDGKDIIEKAEWYESLDPNDAIYIDEVFSELNNVFGVKLTKEHQCRSCDKVFDSYIDIGGDFFRPYTNVSLGVTSKAGNLAGITQEPIVSE